MPQLPKGGLRREAAALRTLHAAGLAVPRLLRCTEHCLFLEYIAGTTYADLSEAITFREAAALAHWLAAYHRLTNELRGGDVNLRNFLWTGTECFGGVDFEDPPAVGDQETDQGRIIAFAATYDPPVFCKQNKMCRVFFLQAFLQTGGEQDKIRSAYLQEITAIQQRRGPMPWQTQSAASFFCRD